MTRVKKDENVLQTLLKINRKGDKTDALLFDVLSNCDNKTDLIKNALFNYIVNIQNGNIIDRAYPYNQVGKFMDVSAQQVAYTPVSQNTTTSFIQEEQMAFDTTKNDYIEKEDSQNSIDESNDNDHNDNNYNDYNDYQEDDEDDFDNEYEDDNLDLQF
jgi:hypothetical protein